MGPAGAAPRASAFCSSGPVGQGPAGTAPGLLLPASPGPRTAPARLPIAGVALASARVPPQEPACGKLPGCPTAEDTDGSNPEPGTWPHGNGTGGAAPSPNGGAYAAPSKGLCLPASAAACAAAMTEATYPAEAAWPAKPTGCCCICCDCEAACCGTWPSSTEKACCATAAWCAAATALLTDAWCMWAECKAPTPVLAPQPSQGGDGDLGQPCNAWNAELCPAKPVAAAKGFAPRLG
mmetsp:Transcript_89309/g.158431  ORF Transcript_89309/g.158431 Transcript_89309/m.158431 type:complete len:237 (-) Transcript_89309:927-1637(-)